MATKKKNVGSAKKPTVKKASLPAKTSTKKAAKKKVTAPKSEAKKVASTKKPAAKAAPGKKATSVRAKNQKSITKKAIVKKTTTVKKAAPATGQKTAASKKAKPATTSKKAVEKTEKVKQTAKKAAPKKAAPKKETKQTAPPAPAHKPEKEVKTAAKTVSTSRSSSTKPPKFVYKPEPSILDIPKENGPRRRYSDNELQEFKDLIQRKLESARKELVYLQGLITRKDEAGTDDTENKYMGVEDGGGTMEREQLSQLASRQIQYIDHLEKALVRIENKTYGICRETGRLIDKARLRAVPHATLSIEAKLAKKK
jgi:RNA polymerase-binding transcription factor DksA